MCVCICAVLFSVSRVHVPLSVFWCPRVCYGFACVGVCVVVVCVVVCLVVCLCMCMFMCM